MYVFSTLGEWDAEGILGLRLVGEQGRMEWFHSTCSIIVALIVLLFSISMTKGVNREYQFDVNVQQQEASSMLVDVCSINRWQLQLCKNLMRLMLRWQCRCK